jgi:hypothetical protein
MLDWHIRKLILADDNNEKILTLHDDGALEEAKNQSGSCDEFLNTGRSGP